LIRQAAIGGERNPNEPRRIRDELEQLFLLEERRKDTTSFRTPRSRRRRKYTKAKVEPSTRLGRDMQWYVYLITIPAAAFLGQVGVELVGRPFRAVLRLRQRALERMLAYRNLSLPRPRESAVSSQQIREYDRAVQSVRQAQRTFGDLGAQLLAFSETESTVRSLMSLCGLDIVQAGHELINLSELYAAARIDSDELRHAIEEAHHAAGKALAVSRRLSGDNLIKIRLEPIRLRDVRYRNGPIDRPRTVSRRAPPRARSSEQIRKGRAGASRSAAEWISQQK
jgi:hypothetical protein